MLRLRTCGAIPPLSLQTFVACIGPPFTSYILWYRHELTRSACSREGRATTRMRTTLLLNAAAVPQTLVSDSIVLQWKLSGSHVFGIKLNAKSLPPFLCTYPALTSYYCALIRSLLLLGFYKLSPHTVLTPL